MLVKNGTTGQVMDTTLMTFSTGPYQAARTWPLLSTEPTDVAYVGTLVSGTPFAYTGQSAVGYLVWSTPGNPAAYQWQMASTAVVATAIGHLMASIAGGALAGTLNMTTGAFTWTAAGS